MHAQQIIQDFLARDCDFVHAKRRATLATMADADSRGCLSLMGLGRALGGHTGIRHRIKRCDRLLGNRKLANERSAIYGAMAKRLLHRNERPLIIIDWSDLRSTIGSAGILQLDSHARLTSIRLTNPSLGCPPSAG